MKLAVLVLPARDGDACGWAVLVMGGMNLGDVQCWCRFELGSADSLNDALLSLYEAAAALGGDVYGLYAGAQLPKFVREAELGRI